MGIYYSLGIWLIFFCVLFVKELKNINEDPENFPPKPKKYFSWKYLLALLVLIPYKIRITELVNGFLGLQGTLNI